MPEGQLLTMRIAIQTTQEFHVTYVVDAESNDEAWEKLMSATNLEVNCDDQVPGEITGSKNEAGFEEVY